MFISPDCIKVIGEHSHEEELERISQARKVVTFMPDIPFNDSKDSVFHETESEIPKIKEEPIETI